MNIVVSGFLCLIVHIAVVLYEKRPQGHGCFWDSGFHYTCCQLSHKVHTHIKQLCGHIIALVCREEVWSIKVKDSVLDVVGSDDDFNLFAGLADGTVAIILV